MMDGQTDEQVAEEREAMGIDETGSVEKEAEAADESVNKEAEEGRRTGRGSRGQAYKG